MKQATIRHSDHTVRIRSRRPPRTVLSAIVVGFVLIVSACASTDTDVAAPVSTTVTTVVASTTTTTLPPTTVPPTTIAAVDKRCEGTTESVLGSFVQVLDDADNNPELAAGGPSSFATVFEEMGTLIAADCGFARAGEPLSAVVLFLVDEVDTRPPLTQTLINDILGFLCNSWSGVTEFSAEAQDVCATA